MSYDSLTKIATEPEVVAVLNMQETTGTAVIDTTGTNNDGTTAGMGANPPVESGPRPWLDSAYDLDGVDDEITVTQALGASYTVSWWMYAANQLVGNGRIFQSGNTGWWVANGTGRLWGRHNGTDVVSSAAGPVVTDGWYQITVVRDELLSTEKTKLYVNGVLFSSGEGAADALTITKIGDQDSGGSHYRGRLTGYAAWSRALSAVEVASLSVGPAPKPPTTIKQQTPTEAYTTSRGHDAIGDDGIKRAANEVRQGLPAISAVTRAIPSRLLDIGGGLWRLRCSGTDIDGVGVLAMVDSNTALFKVLLDGDPTTVITEKSLLRDGRYDLMIDQAEYDASRYHEPISFRMTHGIMTAKCAVKNSSNTTIEWCQAWSVDSGITWQLSQRVDVASPYIATSGSIKGPWSSTIEPRWEDGVFVGVTTYASDYQPNPGSTGGEHWRNDIDYDGSDWTSRGMRLIHDLVQAGTHAHSAFGGLLLYGDGSFNSTYQYTVDGHYTTGTITVTQVEANGKAFQGVSGVEDALGNAAFAADNHACAAVFWNAAKQRFELRHPMTVWGRNGNEALFLTHYEGVGYLGAFASSGGLPATANNRFMFSVDAVDWVPLAIPRQFNASNDDVPRIFGNKIVFVDGTDLLSIDVPKVKKEIPVQSSPGATITPVTWTYAVWGAEDGSAAEECPFVGGLWMHPAGHDDAGQPLEKQYAPGSPVIWIKSRDDGSVSTPCGYFKTASNIDGHQTIRVNFMPDGDAITSASIHVKTPGGSTTPGVMAANCFPGAIRTLSGMADYTGTAEAQINIGVGGAGFFQLGELTSDTTYSGSGDANYSGITDSDYLQVTMPLTGDTTEITFVGDLHQAGTQQIAGQTWIQDWRLLYFGTGNLVLVYINTSGSATNISVGGFSDGEHANFTLSWTRSTGEVSLTDNIDGTHAFSVSSVPFKTDSTRGTDFRIGRYQGGGNPATAIVFNRLAIGEGSGLIHDWDFTKHPTDDQAGSADLTVVGSPIYSATADDDIATCPLPNGTKTATFIVRITTDRGNAYLAAVGPTSVLLATVNAGSADRLDLTLEGIDADNDGTLKIELFVGGVSVASATIADSYLIGSDQIRIAISTDGSSTTARMDHMDRAINLIYTASIELLDITGGDTQVELMATGWADYSVADLSTLRVSSGNALTTIYQHLLSC